MILNKKGISLIEIIISIALISVLTLFMYRLLADVTFQKDNEYFASMNQQTKVEILDYLHEHYAYSRVDSYTCTKSNKSCTFKRNGAEQFSFELSKTDNKYYFIIKKGSTVIKKWYLYQIYDGKIIVNQPDDIDDIYFISVKLYTNNLDNNDSNNNTLDDIEFTINCSENLEQILLNSFVTIQCRQKEFNTYGWLNSLNNPSSYDFENNIAGDCNFAGTKDLNIKKPVVKWVFFPIDIVKNEEDKTYYVHFCRMGDSLYIYGFYSALGAYPTIAKDKDNVNGQYNFNDFTGEMPIGDRTCYSIYDSGPYKGTRRNPCRTRYNADNSYIDGYSVEFIVHYFNYEDNPNTDESIKRSCINILDGIDSSYNTKLYGELLTYNKDSGKREVTQTCRNNECLNADGKSIWYDQIKNDKA